MKTQTLLLLAVVLPISSLFAQEMPMDDPYVQNANRQETRDTINISICYEDFSMPLALAAKLQRENLTDAELYQRIVESLGKEVKQESLCVIRSRPTLKATSGSITETIYPTEYEPGTMPVSLTIDGAVTPESARFCRIPATPTSFETRNVGFSLEVDPTFGEDLKTLRLLLCPEHVVLVGKTEAGIENSKTTMPTFETQRLSTSVMVNVGIPAFIGTMNRSPESVQDPDSANKVWFAFVTATLAK
ncbi:hypothetical protein JIN85_00075 [Luteolibacter pohnpeiensis]|uniref:Uncharacterized protein n=1 Tax=Luteolibacter pohnpeiensis TaxID=454153 RepID=A0A934S410_9BACT|nr:hypothetical protein [Luteolibacter pohnpeiensis]MBK1880785.1 hypothetical protein [Luteolibacter pohnpeiensis]